MQDFFSKESKIHEKGIFAARDFLKGEIVISLEKKDIPSQEDFDKLSESEKECVSYIGGHYIVIPKEGRLNHSCSPNVYLDKEELCYIALRKIKEGEEITTDYSGEAGPGLEMICSCGSSNCRGIIKSF